MAVIPALNEEASITRVVDSLRDLVHTVVVCDNGSTDATASLASEAGAIVVFEPHRGYGAACQRALMVLQTLPHDIVLFVDADLSDDPRDVPRVLEQVINGRADLVIGSRLAGSRERGSLTPPQVFGNWLATWLIALLWRVKFTDLGPMRAITTRALEQLDMQDRAFGWTVEMQIKAAKLGLRCAEVPVSYRRRVGTSKISGTVSGTIRAGITILSTIARYAIR
jgi:glycosyltransferase involved in cell wall biosynthesis